MTRDAMTGLVAAGCNVVIFFHRFWGHRQETLSLPVVKISTNSAIAQRLSDMIDYDCGPVIKIIAIAGNQ